METFTYPRRQRPPTTPRDRPINYLTESLPAFKVELMEAPTATDRLPPNNRTTSDAVTNVASVANGAFGTPLWTQKTPDEILQDFNELLTSAWAAAGWAVLPDSVLLPPVDFGYIATQKVSMEPSRGSATPVAAHVASCNSVARLMAVSHPNFLALFLAASSARVASTGMAAAPAPTAAAASPLA